MGRNERHGGLSVRTIFSPETGSGPRWFPGVKPPRAERAAINDAINNRETVINRLKEFLEAASIAVERNKSSLRVALPKRALLIGRVCFQRSVSIPERRHRSVGIGLEANRARLLIIQEFR
ncbi:hypothetical protein [Methylobacterium brachythecii]|uniref:Uncharacterized protein n=1 Tax=Methylobacterium brachythecii TaxID=1176177 RepID=A0ABQ6D3I2_9HYPH|nr:hypothetical protein [Methylobacterium brachythecii]GLS42812.1 hypothetical protein GCM10007884_07970 [Methylobacterium brachythecii]